MANLSPIAAALVLILGTIVPAVTGGIEWHRTFFGAGNLLIS